MSPEQADKNEANNFSPGRGSNLGGRSSSLQLSPSKLGLNTPQNIVNQIQPIVDLANDRSINMKMMTEAQMMKLTAEYDMLRKPNGSSTLIMPLNKQPTDSGRGHEDWVTKPQNQFSYFVSPTRLDVVKKNDKLISE